MKRLPMKGVATFLVATILILPAVSHAQFGGIVYDPTNYANALLRYNQLVQQLAQLRQTYQQVLNQYNLALQMARNLENMPARYRAVFSQWRNFTASDLYGNTSGWVGAVNGAGPQSVSPAYQQATIPLLTYSQADLNAINPIDAGNLRVCLCVTGTHRWCECLGPDNRRKHSRKCPDRAAANCKSRTRTRSLLIRLSTPK